MDSVFPIIATFLHTTDLQCARSVNRRWRKMVENPNVWVLVSKRDLPVRVNDIRAYQRLDWTTVYEWERQSIRNAWADGWLELQIINRNGRCDHIIAAIVNHILANNIRTGKLRIRQQLAEHLDERIAMQKQIEQLLDQSEELEQDLYDHARFHLPAATINALRYK